MLKKIGLIVVLSLFITISGFCTGTLEKGNGDIVTIERPVSSSFKGVLLRGQAEVNIFQSEDVRISVTIDSNLQEYIQTDIINGVLEINTRTSDKLKPKVNRIDIYSPNFSYLALSGSGNILFPDKINGETLRLDISGDGRITGELEYSNLTANISGKGKIILTGKSQSVYFGLSGSGNFECEELEINDAIVEISGAGGARINVINSLHGIISGVGNIKYRGNPTITFDKSGIGRISTLN